MHEDPPRARHESAGVLLYRRDQNMLQLLLVHPGGPFWRKRDRSAWQIPKGEVQNEECPEAAARREVREELGISVDGALMRLGQLRQAGGKLVTCFAIEQDIDASAIVSNMLEIEWPPKSGRMQSFPEVDAARWFTVPEAEVAILASQRPFLDQLVARLA